MAFVFQSPRQLHQKQKQWVLPPGSYQFKQGPSSTIQSYAPFDSITPRSKQIKPLIDIGPANYNTSLNIIQPLCQFIQHKNGGVLLKFNGQGTSSFKSGVDRFQEKKNSDQPGPGNYNIPLKKSALINPRKPHKGLIIKQNRVSSIPQKPFYLFKKQNPQQPQLLRGPGKYQISPPKKTSYSFTTTKRFQQTDQQHPGPGQYHKMSKNANQHNNNPTSNFSSQTSKSYFDKLLYNTNIPYKARLRQQIKYKNSQPGPGQYNLNKNQQLISRFQFFGSTTSRFQQSSSNKTPGPGSYKQQLNPSLPNTKRAGLDMLSYGPRDQLFPVNQDIPGPGQYTNHQLWQPAYSLSKKGKSNILGGQQPRFSFHDQHSPGPGHYSHINFDQKKQSASFLSHSQRSVPGDELFVTDKFYQVNSQDVSSKLRKRKTFLQHLNLINVKKPAFDSSHIRFQHYQKQRHDDKQNQNNQKKLVQVVLKRKPQQQLPVTKYHFGREERFRSSKYKSPGVGYYNNINRSPLNKQSFNSKYIFK